MELAARAEAPSAPSHRGFLFKLAAALALVALADHLFFFQRAGSTLGLYALAVLAAVLLAGPALRRRPDALAAAAAAPFFAFVPADHPSPLAAALFLASATMAALLPRTVRFDDGWRWGRRLFWHALLVGVTPLRDGRRLIAARRRRGPPAIARLAPVLVLPLAGSAVFLALFSAANPLIGDAFGRVDLWLLLGDFSTTRLLFWLVVAMLVWSVLRPQSVLLPPPSESRGAFALPGVSLESVTLSLLAFNVLFALQNGLDLAFLWSGAPLPQGMTLADYAHRGAYPLIATALLAGLFVLVALRPGSDTAGSAPVRRLVYLWTAQNVLLVASTILRTLDYVDAYSLTRLRIAALLWMALVATGLVLICVRLWLGKSGAWLINANLAAALVILAACSLADLGAVAAAWNVRHAREAGGRGSALDLCYLNRLRESALMPLIELESRPLHPAFRERVSWARNLAMDRLTTSQGDWHGWTFRNHRRLEAADRLVAERGLPRFSADIRDCSGTTSLTRL
jgi:Domain of unknown function (DUF4173)